jgi:hypothetical protein
MTIIQTTIASIGRVALAAAAANRPLLARADERPAVSGGPAKAATGIQLGPGNSLYELLLHATIASAWLSERRTLHGRSLARDAQIMVTAKDVLVAGTVLTGAANVVGLALRREPPVDPVVSEDGQPSSDAATGADGNRRYLRTMTALNRTFALLGVAATPFINFALFDSYHPHPVRSFFSLW